MGLIFLDGQWVTEENAKVSVFDHGYLYGDGVFEGIRAYKGRVFKLREHVDRMFESAHSILLNIPVSKEEIEEVICEAVRRNELSDAYIRVVVSRGKGDLGLDPAKCPRSTLVVIADKIALFPDELYENGLKVVTVPTRRNLADALDPKIKSLNYLNNILVKLEANQAGVLEAIMVNNQGYVAEGSGDNIFIVKRGEIFTPPSYVGVLQGITRAVMMEMAEKNGIPVYECPFTRHDLYNADECFLTGTAAEAIPVIEVDGRRIGSGSPGLITRRLIRDFREYAGSHGTEVYGVDQKQNNTRLGY